MQHCGAPRASHTASDGASEPATELLSFGIGSTFAGGARDRLLVALPLATPRDFCGNLSLTELTCVGAHGEVGAHEAAGAHMGRRLRVSRASASFRSGVRVGPALWFELWAARLLL